MERQAGMLSFVKFLYQPFQVKYQSHLQGEHERLRSDMREKQMAGGQTCDGQKRAFPAAFVQKGVLTVEAAFVLPLFLLASMTLLGFA